MKFIAFRRKVGCMISAQNALFNC